MEDFGKQGARKEKGMGSDPRHVPQSLLGSSQGPVGLRRAVAGHSVLGALLHGHDGPGTGAGAETTVML